MNYGLFIKISLIIAIISTLCICAIKPKMHNSVMIYDHTYKITTQNISEQTEKNLPVINQDDKQTSSTTKIDNQIETNIKNTTPKTNKSIDETKSKTVKTVTTVTQPKINKTLSKEQEEEILWNKWHSNLRNQIMKDVNMPIMPLGTVFKYEFDVDQYGKVSNVQTWSTTPAYTPYSIQYIAPVIRNYQGHSILNFPKGSKRTEVHVTGGWKIARKSRYTSPRDFNDVEKIKK